MIVKKTLVSLLSIATALPMFGADIEAFPGARGWGRWALGARASSAPTVYHVTNLNDSGSGSLRDAVSQSNRIIVFDVSGVIRLSSRMTFASNLYVAGQTAPGEGITLYGNGVSFSNASNIICRYLRVRMGHGGESGKDCAGISSGTNMIFDHCSFSWGLDETFSINPDGKGELHDITLMNCIFGQGLMTHSAGGLMQADYITLYRNLYIDNSTRNNKVKGINQYANNVVYNWSNGAYIMGGDSEGSSYVNIESNLFINGPSTGASANGFTGANEKFHCYGVDNWQDNNKDGKYDPYEMTNYSASDHRTTDPYDYPALELYPGNQLIELNIPTVGASLPYRDQSDCYMIDELMSMGTQGALISNEESLPIGSPATWTWWTGSKPADTDGDGMPDAWEEANGTNKNQADATVKAANGYLNIENYINSITVEDRQYFLRQPITLSASASTTSTLTLAWRDYTYAEEGFAVEVQQENGAWQEVGRTVANATTFTVTGLTAGTAYNVRVCAFGHNQGEEQFSAYTTGTYKTRPLEVGMVDIDSYQADVTNSVEVQKGQKLLLHTDDVLDYVLTAPISPAAVVATGTGVITVSGEAICDSASVNKGGQGTLILNNENQYLCATVLHEGVLAFNTIANGGQPSAIGASQEYAQNWVMDGGTYRYTGSTNATTNRNARLMNPTTLEITSGKTLTMTGTIEGEGENQDMTFAGNGQITVGSTNFFGYTGTTTVKGGTLYLSSTEISKAGIGKSSKLILAGGKLATKGESSNYETYTFPIELQEGTYSYFAPNRNCSIKCKLLGAGTLEFVIPYVREYFDANVLEFTGKIIANDNKNAGWLCPSGSFNMPTTQVELQGKTIMCMWATNGNGFVGGISGGPETRMTGSSKQTDGVTCNWTVGGANSDETFQGTIDNSSCASGHYNKAVNITKVGTGLWRLTGSNKYQGATTVNGGTLIINGYHSGSCGYASAVASTYVVNEGGTLKGFGKISNSTLTVNNGGVLAAGDTLVANHIFTINNTVNLQSGATLEVPVSYHDGVVKNNRFAIGTLKIADGAVLKFDLTEVESPLTVNTALPVIDGNVSISGTFSSVEPATPGEGLKWDLSRLYVDGKVYVRDESFDSDNVTYKEASWFDESAIDAAGYYWFNEENEETTNALIESGAIAFDAGGKATSAPTYSNTASQHVGGLKLNGNLAEVIFHCDSKFMSAKFDFFRAGSSALAGNVFASTDGETWTKLTSVAGDPKTEIYVDCSDAFKGKDYTYIKITNATTAVMYLQGAAITFEKMVTGIEQLKNEHASVPVYDLQGRRNANAKGLQIKGGNVVLKK